MRQRALFSEDPTVVDVGDPSCVVRLDPGYLDAEIADGLLSKLLAEVPWRQRHMVVFGDRHPIPRLEAWFGDAEATYGYSGAELEHNDWHPALDALRRRLVDDVGEPFNGVLANRYRSGADKVGWHADDEEELGPNPVIASISLGATRRFRIRHREFGVTASVDLEHGSLLVMTGSTQERCVHALPSTRSAVGERVNLTFRRVRRR